MNKDLDELRKAWEELPEGMEDWIDLYSKGHSVACVYKSNRDFDEVFVLEDQYPYVWWLTAEVAIEFDSWEKRDMSEIRDSDNPVEAAQIIDFHRTPEIKPDSAHDCLINIEYKFATARVDLITKWLIDELYETYKDSGIDKLLVIDRKEFERFVKRCYPLWKEGKI